MNIFVFLINIKIQLYRYYKSKYGITLKFVMKGVTDSGEVKIDTTSRSLPKHLHIATLYTAKITNQSSRCLQVFSTRSFDRTEK